MAKFIVSTSDTSFIENLASNLLNSISTYNSRGKELEDTRLYERNSLIFRDVVNSVFPSMLIIDNNNTLQELRKYKDIIKSTQDLLGKDYKPTEKTIQLGASLTSSEIILMMQIIRRATKILRSKAIQTSYKILQNELSKLSTPEIDKNTITKSMNSVFNKVYYLTDVSTTNRHIIIFPSFNVLTSEMSDALEIATSTLAAENELNGKTMPADDLTINKFLNYGHTAVGYTDNKGNINIKFNTPKIVAILYDVIGNTSIPNAKEKALEMSTSFINSSKQLDEYIKIDKNFSEDFISIFISYGGNVVRFENAAINQLRGASLEKYNIGVNKKVLAKLAEQFKGLGRTSLGSTILKNLLKGRGSPSLIDYIIYGTISGYESKPIQSFKGTSSAKKSTKTTVKVASVKGIVKSSSKISSIPIPHTRSKINIKASTYNLTSLQSLLNLSLYEQIKRNMGTGDRYDVLNFRTGRFARSAVVQRLTQSREGMITAFYAYMKNPYATFSEGGRQQFPRSRDPKLLISKSIREILAAQAVTKARAVSL